LSLIRETPSSTFCRKGRESSGRGGEGSRSPSFEGSARARVRQQGLQLGLGEEGAGEGVTEVGQHRPGQQAGELGRHRGEVAKLMDEKFERLTKKAAE
jgi:hypothetical protein